ncbi:carbohydrate sulfotransferase 4 [Aplysia californica]|uniref:Carbohydrate sulfotransferase 4 n=1 Tax=Aplysia californica TaxID=6500 RepID=A0ABM1ABU3_APLCA|nr:carbohydrate sulfotransferase 4 [Aplysia californica]
MKHKRRSKLSPAVLTVCGVLVYLSLTWTYLTSHYQTVYWISAFLFGVVSEPVMTTSCGLGDGQVDPGRTNKSKLILLSYMRSGSTYTGSLLALSPDVFYYFEPLLYTHDDDLEAIDVPIMSRLSFLHPFFPYPPKVLDFLHRLLQCQPTTHDLKYLLGAEYSESLTNYRDCTQKLRSIEDISSCLPLLANRCQSKAVTTTKTVRLKMEESEKSMRCDPGVKVIHLVRDPRPVFLSREAMHYYFDASTFCQRVARDARESLRLQKIYPDRMRTLRYEDLATAPVRTTKAIYEFAGIPWMPKLESRLRSETDSQKPYKIASRWRRKITHKQMKSVQDVCGEMMTIFGYNHFYSNDHLRDMQQPSWTKSYSEQFRKFHVES